MPRYDYRCTECDRQVEVSHGFDEDGPDSCTKCGAPMRKVFGRVALAFRGSGFHVTDYGPSRTAASDR